MPMTDEMVKSMSGNTRGREVEIGKVWDKAEEGDVILIEGEGSKRELGEVKKRVLGEKNREKGSEVVGKVWVGWCSESDGGDIGGLKETQ